MDPIDIAITETRRLLLKNRPISLKNIPFSLCGIDQFDFMAVKNYELTHPEVFKFAIELTPKEYGDPTSDSTAYLRFVGAQMAACDAIFNMDGFQDLIKDIKKKAFAKNFESEQPRKRLYTI